MNKSEYQKAREEYEQKRALCEEERNYFSPPIGWT